MRNLIIGFLLGVIVCYVCSHTEEVVTWTKTMASTWDSIVEVFSGTGAQ